MKKDTKKVVTKPKEEEPPPKGIIINLVKVGAYCFSLGYKFWIPNSGGKRKVRVWIKEMVPLPSLTLTLFLESVLTFSFSTSFFPSCPPVPVSAPDTQWQPWRFLLSLDGDMKKARPSIQQLVLIKSHSERSRADGNFSWLLQPNLASFLVHLSKCQYVQIKIHKTLF